MSHFRQPLAVLILALGLLLLASCGEQGAVESTNSQSTDSRGSVGVGSTIHVSSATTAGHSAQKDAQGTSTVPAHSDGSQIQEPASASACQASQVEVTIQPQPSSAVQPADRVRSLIGVTNRGSAACELDGFGQLLQGSSDPVPLPSSDVNVPGPAVPLLIDPQSTAYAGVEWTTDPSCGLVLPLRVSLSWGVEVSVPVILTGGLTGQAICPWSVSLGPFSPNAQQVADFPDSVGTGINACTSNDLSAVYTADSESRGTVTLSNSSTAVCLLAGSVGIDFLSSSHPQLLVSGQWTDSIPTVELQPEAEVTVGIDVKQSGSAGSGCVQSAQLVALGPDGKRIPSKGTLAGRVCGLDLQVGVPVPASGGS